MSRRSLVLSAAIVFALNGRAEDADSKLDNELKTALDEAKPDAPIPIFILLARQNRLAEMKQYAAAHRKAELRLHALERMKEIARAEQEKLLAALHPAVESGRAFWVVNGIEARGKKAAVARLAESPLVARLYLRTEKPEAILIPSGRRSQVFPQPAPSETQPYLKPDRKVVWSLRHIGAERAWRELGIAGRGVTVALLDSGMNYRHPDIRDRLWVNTGEIPGNGIDDDHDGYVDDYYGYNFANRNANISDDFFHGTICGAIISGDGTSGIVTGVAPESRLMILRMYDQTANYNTRWLWQFYQYDAWEAFEYALDHGAQVVNMSFDWQPSEKPLHAAWRYALENVIGAGVTLVAGAGNSRPSLPVPFQLTPPASIPDVISAGGVVEGDGFLEFSSRGPVAWNSFLPFADFPYPPGFPKPDIAAPVSVGDFPLVMFSGTGYVIQQRNAGTSTAAPHVAGVAALLLEQNPELYPWQIREILAATARDLGAPGYDPYYGAGLVDAYAALRFDRIPRLRLEEPCDGRRRIDAKGNFTLALGNEGADAVDLAVALEFIYPKTAKNPPSRTIRRIARGGRDSVSFSLLEPLRGFTGTARLHVTVSIGNDVYLRRPVRVELGAPDLLLVDDDGGGEFENFYEAALGDLDLPYAYRSARGCSLEPGSLKAYRTVVWITGEENRETLTASDIRLLEEHLDAGRKLVLLGQHLASDLGDSPFLARLGIERAAESAGPDRFILTRAGVETEIRRAPESWRFDGLRPRAGARELFRYAPVERATGAVAAPAPLRAVTASAGLEAVETAGRARLLEALLDR